MDDVDRNLLALLQQDATTPYATLGQRVGLSTAAAHDRVRKLRERGVIRRTTIEVDPATLGRDVLAFVMLDGDSWMGGPATGAALCALPFVEEAHIVAGEASLLVKARVASTGELQAALRRLYDIDGVSSTRTIVVLHTFCDRPVDPGPDAGGAR